MAILSPRKLNKPSKNLIAQANGEEVVVFTDLLGGSINSAAALDASPSRFCGGWRQYDSAAGVFDFREEAAQTYITYATNAARESIVFINTLITTITIR